MGEMRTSPLVKGLLTFVPGVGELLPSKSPGHTDSAEYCYGVWLKHLTLLHAHGMREIPDIVAELGPGESVGVGLAALLSGANHYFGLDVVAHSDAAANSRMLEELLMLFRHRAPNPDKGWPHFDSYLDEGAFPSHILPEQVLERSLARERIDHLRAALDGRPRSGAITAEYKAPWSDSRVLVKNSVDLIISHSVLEHVVDLEATYRALHQWLKPAAWMSHQIDLKSHGLSKRWNGFRSCSDLRWKMTLGRRAYMINRQPASAHRRLMEKAGFSFVTYLEHFRDDGIARDELDPRWADISDEDLRCSGVYVIARK